MFAQESTHSSDKRFEDNGGKSDNYYYFRHMNIRREEIREEIKNNLAFM